VAIVGPLNQNDRRNDEEWNRIETQDVKGQKLDCGELGRPEPDRQAIRVEPDRHVGDE
jgi:hypothetical protein